MSTWSKDLGIRDLGVSRRPAGVLPMVSSLQYRDLATQLPPVSRMARKNEQETLEAAAPPPPEVAMSRAELEILLARTRSEAVAQVEAKLRAEQAAQAEQNRAQLASAIERFERDRKQYFGKVETEVVRLALSIAAKILHREAQVDPMLVAALVQIAVNQLKENSAVNVRVAPAVAPQWRAFFGASTQWAAVTVIEDAELAPGDCLLETELGSANFSLAAQLKEVEQGFFDVLAHTPRD